jgi:hypothetical protein
MLPYLGNRDKSYKVAVGPQGATDFPVISYVRRAAGMSPVFARGRTISNRPRLKSSIAGGSSDNSATL